VSHAGGYRLVAVFGPQTPGGRAWEARLEDGAWVLRVGGGPVGLEFQRLEDAVDWGREWERRDT
jgi:hypothetical protein